MAPAASASTTAVLAFNQASYSGTACGTITGAYVTVTVNGTPTAGRSVTTTLSGGYTFAGGGTTNTQVSDGSGRVNLPAISVPVGGGAGTLSASSAAASTATATTTSPATGAAGVWRSTGTPTATNLIPSTATPTGGLGIFINGSDIWYGNTLVETLPAPVTKAVGGSGSGSDYVNFMCNGSAYTWRSTTGLQKFASVPATATPTGGLTIFIDGGDIWYGNAKQSTGLTQITGVVGGSDGVDYVNFFADGSARTWRSTIGLQTFSSVPSTASPTGALTIFVNGGDVWYGNAKQTSGFSQIEQANGGSGSGSDYVNFFADGKARTWRSTIGFQTFSNIPATAVPTAGLTLFVDKGDVWYGNTKTNTGLTQITAAAGGSNGVDYVNYMGASC